MDQALVRWLMADEFGDLADVDVPAWYADAACVGHDPGEWFPEGQGVHVSKALAVCEDCPVREQCLQHALDRGETVGVWGGMTARQRDHLARQAA